MPMFLIIKIMFSLYDLKLDMLIQASLISISSSDIIMIMNSIESFIRWEGFSVSMII